MGDTAANRHLDAPSSPFAGRTPAEIERDLAISTLIDLNLVHAGRAASLFRAQQFATQRTVAVKVLHDELTSDTGQRFDRERAITGQLSGHTGIVPLFETGTTADGEPYLVMPFYQRGSLADLMVRYGPLPWREATFLLEPVAVTLAEVHGRDLVHRNLKPSNVLLTDFLLPRVSDFGMCLPVGQSSTTATLVATGGYGAPETAEPAPADPVSDVYGLGATLRGLLSGQSPAALPLAGMPAAPQGHRTPSGPLREPTPRPIADLIERSMAPDPADRPPNAAAFVTELRRCVGSAEQPTSIGGASARRDPSPVKRPAAARISTEGPSAEGDPSPRANDETASRSVSEIYLLLLVALITTGILAMVAAAVLTAS